MFFLQPSHHKQIFIVCCWDFVVSLWLKFSKVDNTFKIDTIFFWTWDITVVLALFIVSYGSCLASLFKVVNTLALEFSEDKIIFLIFNDSFKKFRWRVFLSGVYASLGAWSVLLVKFCLNLFIVSLGAWSVLLVKLFCAFLLIMVKNSFLSVKIYGFVSRWYSPTWMKSFYCAPELRAVTSVNMC